MAHRSGQFVTATIVTVLCLTMAACSDPEPMPTPTLAPFPTALPSPTLPMHQVIDGKRYVVLLDGVEVASEELHAQTVDDELLLSSETRYLAPPYTIERRTLVVNNALSPMRYELERTVAGVRSMWVAERTTRGTAVLNNHQVWPGPIAHDGVRPGADILLEAAPSALPYVVLAMRSKALSQSQPNIELQAIDICEDLPVSRRLELSAAPGRTGAVIGTTAIEATLDDGPNKSHALWVRANSGELYGAEIVDFQADYWLARTQSELSASARLEIMRVAELPEIPESTPPLGTRLTFETTDGKSLSAWLSLPQSEGPHACLISLGGGDIVTLKALSEAWAEQGWATCALTPRGTDASEGSYQRGDLSSRADDAIALAQALGEIPEIDARRLVLLGANDAGLAAALAIQSADSLAGAVLVSAACHEPLLPDLATTRALGPLSDAYGWTPDDAERFRLASVDQWQRWLFEREDEVALVGRRVPLNALRAYAETDVLGALVDSDQPVLLLVGENAFWPTGRLQESLAQELATHNRRDVKVAVVPDTSDQLWAPSGTLVGAAREAIESWLEAEGL